MAIGKESRPRRGAEGPLELALDLSGTAIRLCVRAGSGRWSEIGRAPFADENFAGLMDALRVEALAHGPVAVDLWLARDQVLVREYVLPAGTRALREARRRLAAETVYPADELSVALAPARRGEPVTVLATLNHTVAEARDFALRWGFRPGRVSTRAAAARFGATAPVFELPPTRARRLAEGARDLAGGASERTGAAGARRVAAAAVVIFAVGAAAGLAGRDGLGLPPENLPVAAPAVGLALVRLEHAAPQPGHADFSPVERQRIAPPSLAHADGAGRRASRVAPIPAPPSGTPPTALAIPPTIRPMHVGAGRVSPDHARPGRLAEFAALSDGASPAPPADESSRRSGSTIPAPLARASVQVTVRSAASVRVATLTTASVETGRWKLAPPAAAGAPDVGPDGAAVILVADAGAPRAVPAIPEPRPEGEAGTDQEAADAEPDTAVPDGASDLATARAPRPPERPDDLVPARPPGQATAHLAVEPPLLVRQAAEQGGLSLGKTSLIGVLDAKPGRVALLRTSDGGYAKVGRGDMVEGWRVTTINPDSVRLTRGGQNRTLLLVTR